jgi:feruloyl esterase
MRWVLFTMVAGLACTAARAAGDCEQLAQLHLPHASVTVAQTVAAGAFHPARPFSLAGPVQPSYRGLSEFCRVAVEVSPAADSLIKFELWMPAERWNGKFLAVGNGGYSGEIWYPEMIDPLSRGYATASTDTGHAGSADDASFALGHREKWIDFAYRAVHQMTVQSKTIITAYYGNRAKVAYWSGCSTGGRQGLMEAQRYPSDFDGIIAGAPANDMTHLSASAVWNAQALHQTPMSLIPPEKLRVLHAAVLKACDALDGVKDGVLEDPTRCRFDPGVVACTGADGPDCLNPSQVEAARKIYAPLRNPRTKVVLWPGLMPGSEAAWAAGVGPDKREPSALVTGIFRYVVFADPSWDYRTLNFDADIARADRGEGGISNAVSPNLQAFFAHGGKLIQYHGWADPGISPLNSIDYYHRVAKAAGGAGRLSDEYRLFLVPGMNHCRGGDVPDQFDTVSALEQWVERGKAPEQIIASRVRNGRVDRTRPLCPYPQVAVYKGSGSTDDAANFACGER